MLKLTSIASWFSYVGGMLIPARLNKSMLLYFMNRGGGNYKFSCHVVVAEHTYDPSTGKIQCVVMFMKCPVLSNMFIYIYIYFLHQHLLTYN